MMRLIHTKPMRFRLFRAIYVRYLLGNCEQDIALAKAQLRAYEYEAGRLRVELVALGAL